jgi:hypothetical protein
MIEHAALRSNHAHRAAGRVDLLDVQPSNPERGDRRSSLMDSLRERTEPRKRQDKPRHQGDRTEQKEEREKNCGGLAPERAPLE